MAEYTTPEKLWGAEFTGKVYQRSPAESYGRVLGHLQKLLPWADESALRKIL